jgi:hypothetical protein
MDTITFVAIRTPQDVKDDVAAHIPLREVNEGEYFRVKEFDKGAVYQRGHYCRAEQKYECTNQHNGNELLMSGDKLVYVGFEF